MLLKFLPIGISLLHRILKTFRLTVKIFRWNLMSSHSNIILVLWRCDSVTKNQTLKHSRRALCLKLFLLKYVVFEVSQIVPSLRQVEATQWHVSLELMLFAQRRKRSACCFWPRSNALPTHDTSSMSGQKFRNCSTFLCCLTIDYLLYLRLCVCVCFFLREDREKIEVTYHKSC